MINDATIAANRDRVIRLLVETNRAGIMALLEWLDDVGYFDSPCSTQHHGCYTGGLAAHSLSVWGKFIELSSGCGVEVLADSVTLACLLHDVCKAGAYVGACAPYARKKEHPKGHALLSISRIQRFVPLSVLEQRMIKFHMGMFGTFAHSRRGEYHTADYLGAIERDPAVHLMGIADQLVTFEEQAAERAYIAGHGCLGAVA